MTDDPKPYALLEDSGRTAPVTPANTHAPGGESRALPHSILETRIQTALAKEPDLAGARIFVEAFAGTAQLSGAVPSRQAVDRAIEVARAVNGVDDVRNCLQLGPDTAAAYGHR